MVSNLEAFIKDTNKKIKELQENQVKEAKKIVITAYGQVIELSPVYTGLFRHNNFITRNGLSNKINENVVPSMIGDNKEAVMNMPFKNSDTIHIQNNLKYADAIEGGQSKQAPDGVYGIVEAKMRRYVNTNVEIK